MKGKALIVWVLVLAATAGAWFISDSWLAKKETAQAQADRLFNLGDPLGVMSLELSGSEVTNPIRIERQEQEHRWLIEEPLVWPADGNLVGRILDSLLAAKAKERHQALGRLADFGLAPPAFKVVIGDRAGTKSEALFGELSPGKDFLYAMLPGSTEVWFLPADLRGSLAKTLFDLRAKGALDFVAADVAGVNISLGDKRLECARTNQGAQPTWEVKDRGPADSREVDKLIYQVRGVMATSFQDQGINLERMGLTKPWGQVRLTMAQGPEIGLVLGGQVPGQSERYVRRLEGGPVMTVKQESLDRLAVDPKELLERRLLKLEREQIVGLTIKRGEHELRYEKRDAGFVRISPPGDAQAGEAAELFLFDLLNLRWDKHAPATKPLDQPGAVITVNVAAPEGQAKTATLILGSFKGEGPLEARVEGDGQAYSVPRDFAGKLPSLEGQAADQ